MTQPQPKHDAPQSAPKANANSAAPLLDHINTPADLKSLSDEQLHQLATEVRQATIQAVSKTGGHLGAGLGVVELTVAIHAVFNTPEDRLVWDVGHQCYPHKILTGRKDRIDTLRQPGGGVYVVEKWGGAVGVRFGGALGRVVFGLWLCHGLVFLA